MIDPANPQSIQELRDRLDSMEFLAGNLRFFGSELIDRLEAAEADQQPRPMVDAPRETDIMLTIGARYRGDEDEPYRMGLLGWLPLPDQSPLPDREDSPDNPEIGASGKTES